MNKLELIQAMSTKINPLSISLTARKNNIDPFILSAIGIENLFSVIQKELILNKNVRISGFGEFQIQKNKRSHNKRIVFKPSKTLTKRCSDLKKDICN